MDGCTNCSDECKENILEIRKLNKIHHGLLKKFEK